MSSAEIYVLRYERELRAQLAPAFQNASRERIEWLETRIHETAMEKYRKVSSEAKRSLSL